MRLGRRSVARSPRDALSSRGTALATIGLAVVLALLTAICTWVALDASRTSDHATAQLRVASAQEAVLEAALDEHAAQLHYLECPLAFDPSACATQERRNYEEARRRLGVALRQVEATGDARDRSGAAYVRLLENRYDLTVQRQFAAIDGGRDLEARALERDTSGPDIEQVLRLVRGAAETHRVNAAAGIERLGDRTRSSATLIPVVFGLAFVLLGGCWAVLWSLQRRLRRQAAALFSEKVLLDAVISAIHHLVYWKDSRGRYQGMNRAFVEQREADPDSEGLPLMLAELEGDVGRSGKALMDYQVTVRGPGGSPRQLLISVIPRRGSGDTLDGVIGVGTDVTRVRELEHQLAQAQRLESIGQLAAGVAHEINTPMQFLTDNTKFLSQSVHEVLGALAELDRELDREQPDPAAMRATLGSLDLPFLQEELPDALSESRAGLQRVTEIVRAMKAFSHPGQGRCDTDVNAAIDSTVKVSRGEWKHVAEMDLDLDPELGAIPCYEGELKQVLLNIVVNAAQAIEEGQSHGAPGPGHIRISTRRRQDRAWITIADDGPGMSDEVRQRAFDPFFTTKDVGKGTGQGLAIAHATIVKKHHGTIEITSRPGEGTTFTISLPLRPPVDESATTAGTSAAPASSSPASSSPTEPVPATRTRRE